MTPEGKVKARILAAVGRRADLMIWNNPTGAARTIDGERIMRFGLPGSPDMLGVLSLTITPEMVGMTLGRAVGIEAKAPRGVQSEQQQRFQAAFERRGGLYILARSEADVLARLP